MMNNLQPLQVPPPWAMFAPPPWGQALLPIGGIPGCGGQRPLVTLILPPYFHSGHHPGSNIKPKTSPIHFKYIRLLLDSIFSYINELEAYHMFFFWYNQNV